jgi:ParB family transcriptional regulator, chromosome partitioning protein
MTRKSVLGKGLSALIQAAETSTVAGGTEIRPIPLGRIVFNPDQPRKDFDATKLEELAASIRQVGVLQPVLVRELTPSEASKLGGAEGQAPASAGPRFVVVAGERRVRAARIAEQQTVPAIVCSYEETEALKIALLENIQRQDLGAIEEAGAYQRLLDAYGATQDELAGMLGKSRSGVANALRLLTLEEQIRALVQQGKLSRGHAKVLLGLAPGPPRIRLAQLCVTRGLSVRECERRVQIALRGARPARRRTPAATDAAGESKEVRALRERAESRLGSPVTILRQPDGKGSLTVSFYSDADLERVLDLMGIDTDLG